MKTKDELIEQLHQELLDRHYQSDRTKAEDVADQLERVLGEPTEESLRWKVHSWVLIAEARGNIEEAIRLSVPDIARKRKEIESGDFDPYPELLAEQIEYLQDSLYLQALRYNRIGKTEHALECLRESIDVSQRFGFEPDNDSKSLYTQLTS